MQTCVHMEQARDVAPRTDGCEECLAMGSDWVELRTCLVCGHVGCCDSSQHRHATAHYRHTGHPVIRSAQPGADWGWCYEDEMMLGPFPELT